MVRSIRAAMTAAGLAAAAVLTTGASADEAKAPPKSVPPGVPLVLTVSGKVKYTFDPAPLTADAYKKAIDNAAKPGKKGLGFGGKLPNPPVVDLTVELKNTSDKALTVWTKGDPVVLTLNLAGAGSANLDPPIAMTQEFRIPQETKLEPGKSYSWPVKQLKSGMRGATHYSYWTGPGEYELTASLRTGVQPVPKGATDNDGFGVVTLTSVPLKLTVEGK
ncbi:hypothetical protein [Urbifossiella limnaea]|uniref:Uncharacterized protein n=1 Tax=Urbifossiella limnaea TaxID=2528023 RepID=A0A517XWX3_9BACT|nr:hypothetical protein [Urbifossiella limnaea]QDU22007.1 hypothetical protein ETAA1_39820 [Urbifossiella limnaea]